MNCEWVRQNVTLYVYDELPDDARHEVEQHVNRCTDCAAELQSMRSFKEDVNLVPHLEVTPNLLASARMQLQEALENAEQVHGWRRLFFDPFAVLRQAKFSPALAAAIFIIGFGGGIGTMYQVSLNKGQVTQQASTAVPNTADASITGVKAITQDPSGKVQIQYDRTTTGSAQGTVDDKNIQQLLLLAARDNTNSGVRMDSIDLLKKNQDDSRVREALIFALRYDTNPGVRLKALEGLTSQVKDIRVRNAVIEALLNDNNPGVRAGAIKALETVKADTSVRAALQQLAKDDPNPYIRTESRRVLSTLPQFD